MGQLNILFYFLQEIEEVEVIHLLQSDGLRFLRPWAFQSQWAHKEYVQVSSYNSPFSNLKYIVYLKCRLFLALINITTLTVIEAVENEGWLYNFLKTMQIEWCLLSLHWSKSIKIPMSLSSTYAINVGIKVTTLTVVEKLLRMRDGFTISLIQCRYSDSYSHCTDNSPQFKHH